MFFEFSNPLADFGLQECFIRQVKFVGGGVDIGVSGERQLHERIILFLAEEDTDSGFLESLADVAVKVVDIHLHLPEVLVGEFIGLKVDEAIALQEAVVEHEVNIEMFLIEGEALLARFKEEAFAHLEQEIAHAGDDGVLQLGFRVSFLRLEPEKFEGDGVFNHICRFFDRLPFVSEAHDFILISAESQALIQAGVHLALQLAHAPILGGAFNFVEAARGGIFDTDEDKVVRPRENKMLTF